MKFATIKNALDCHVYCPVCNEELSLAPITNYNVHLNNDMLVFLDKDYFFIINLLLLQV